MATFFGEIQELVSRAVDPDDLEEQSVYSLSTETSADYSSDFKVDDIIFCVGDIAIAFSKCYLVPQSLKPLIDVYYSSEIDEDVSLLYGGKLKTQKNKLAAAVYAIETGIAICHIPFQIPETLYVELLEIILKFITCSSAIVLTSSALVNLKGYVSTDSESLYLMNLATSEFIPPVSFDIHRLESPNFVTGIPAAVLTEFEIRKKSAVCVINYSDSNVIDFENVKAFEKLISIPILKNLIKKDAQILMNYIRNYSHESNLYT